MTTRSGNQAALLPVGVVQFLFEAGGTLAQLGGVSARELDAAYSQAHSLYGSGRWKEALTIFNLLCQQDHLQRRFHLGRAACLHLLKRYHDALSAYGVAHVLDVEEPRVALHIAECLVALGRDEDALQALETVEVFASSAEQHAEVARRGRALKELLERKGNNP